MAYEQVKVVMRDGREYGPVDLAGLSAWVAAGQVPPDAVAICQTTGARRAVGEVLGLPPPGYAAGYPPGPPGAPVGQPQGFQPVDLVAPVNVRNGLALASGYLGIFSFLCMGPLLGIPAIITGILALRRPELGGKGRAWTGIICGGLTTLLFTLLLVLSAFK